MTINENGLISVLFIRADTKVDPITQVTITQQCGIACSDFHSPREICIEEVIMITDGMRYYQEKAVMELINSMQPYVLATNIQIKEQPILEKPMLEDFSQYRNKKLGFALAEFTAILGAVDQTWSLVKSMFSFSSKSEIVANITSMGFDAFSETSLIQSYTGLPSSKVDDFKKYIIKSVEVPPEKIDAFNEMWDWAAFTESGTW